MTDLKAAIANLEKELNGENTPALKGIRYTQTHRKFEAASPQRDRLARNILDSLCENYFPENKALKLLSVGCGDGALDGLILSELSERLDQYTALDPNEDQINACRKRIENLYPSAFLNQKMSANVDGAPFDFAYAVHVIYYPDDPKTFIRNIQQSIKKTGVGLVAVAPKSPMNLIAEVFWKNQGTNALFADDVELLFNTMGISYTRTPVSAEMPLELFFGPNADQDIIDFTVQAETSKLSKKAKAALADTFRAAAIPRQAKEVLDHPVDCFWFSA